MIIRTTLVPFADAVPISHHGRVAAFGIEALGPLLAVSSRRSMAVHDLFC